MVSGTITRPRTLELLNALRKAGSKSKAKIWNDLAYRIRKPSRVKKPVNVGKLSKLYNGKMLVVISKVLADGFVDKKIELACFAINNRAREKIEAKGGKVISLEELIKVNPEGSNLIIIK